MRILQKKGIRGELVLAVRKTSERKNLPDSEYLALGWSKCRLSDTLKA
jgi:hypothetical protein